VSKHTKGVPSSSDVHEPVVGEFGVNLGKGLPWPMATTGTVQGEEIMTPRRMQDKPLEYVLARLHALRQGLDALHRSSQARLRQTEEQIQRAQYQLRLTRLLLQKLQARRRELHSLGRKPRDPT
jgi:hypothetical protein